MAHTHGNEYQVRIVHEDGTEELSGWMTSEAQVAPALAAIHRPHGTAYWLRARTVRCPDCREREQDIWECPLTGIPVPLPPPHSVSGRRGVSERDRGAPGEAHPARQRTDDVVFTGNRDCHRRTASGVRVGASTESRDEPQRAALAGRCARAGVMRTRGNGCGTWG